MIKSILAITGAICALTPSLACLPKTATSEEGPSEARYSSDFQGGEFDYILNRQVYYSTRTTEYYENPYRLPTFVTSLPMACAVSAGGVTITYNDRLYGNLIPNYAPRQTSIRFTYGTQNDVIDNMFQSLYDLMGTNSQGTTISGFKRGMTSYVNNRGYSLDLQQTTGSYSNLNMDYLKAQLRQEKVAVVFVHSFSLVTTTEIQTYDGYDNIPHKLYDGYHVIPVYGYRDFSYYDANGDFIQKDTYLYVQNCYNDATLEFLSVNNYCTIDDAYFIDIH